MTDFNALRNVVQLLLQNPRSVHWELQGFGMLRCYLPNDCRLQVWDDRFANEDVTVIHDHPWHFESLIISGCLHNVRYTEDEDHPCATHMRRTIVPGIGLQVLGEDKPVHLRAAAMESYVAGQRYTQQKDEVHWSRPERGTVTLIQRTRTGPDVARSYYAIGKQWVTAEPRRATHEEVTDIVSSALARGFL